jgi:tetratricopeptide (TPR) repeat protein
LQEEARWTNLSPMKNNTLPSMALAALLFAPCAALAQAQGGEASAIDLPGYDECLALVEEDAMRALDMAQAMKLQRGETEAGALHCEALALMGLNRPDEAGNAFFTLAERLTQADDTMRAEIYAQAGDAWAIAGSSASAIRAYDNAIARMPDEALYYTGRARVKAIAGNWEGTRADAAEALARNPFSVEPLLLRSAANRELGYPRAALVDANNAVDLKPHDLDALLERGLVHHALGDRANAFADWLAVTRYAEETGRSGHPAAQAARQYLEK